MNPTLQKKTQHQQIFKNTSSYCDASLISRLILIQKLWGSLFCPPHVTNYIDYNLRRFGLEFSDSAYRETLTTVVIKFTYLFQSGRNME